MMLTFTDLYSNLELELEHEYYNVSLTRMVLVEKEPKEMNLIDLYVDLYSCLDLNLKNDMVFRTCLNSLGLKNYNEYQYV